MNIYPDETASKRLERAAAATGRTVEDLATSAVEEAALDWHKANPEESEHPMKAGITQDGEDLHKAHPLHQSVKPMCNCPGNDEHGHAVGCPRGHVQTMEQP